jgi:hypothetical protein
MREIDKRMENSLMGLKMGRSAITFEFRRTLWVSQPKK